MIYLESPTENLEVTVTGIGIVRIAGGKIVEDWGGFDRLDLMQQIGAIPPSGETNTV